MGTRFDAAVGGDVGMPVLENITDKEGEKELAGGKQENDTYADQIESATKVSYLYCFLVFILSLFFLKKIASAGPTNSAVLVVNSYCSPPLFSFLPPPFFILKILDFITFSFFFLQQSLSR